MTGQAQGTGFSSQHLPVHLFPHLYPHPHPTTTTTTPPIYSTSYTTPQSVISSNDLGIASNASVNFLLAFFTLLNNLRRNSMEKINRDRDYGKLSLVSNVPLEILSCDFDNDWCPGWNRSTGEDSSWSINQISMQSEGTGPVVDHPRKSAEGGFAFILTSGISTDSLPHFRTPYISLGSHHSYCVSFRYSIRGPGLGSLMVSWRPFGEVKPEKSKFIIANLMQGPQTNGSTWREIAKTVESPLRHGYPNVVHFEFQARRDLAPRSYIAVDDVTLTTGSCQTTSNPPKVIAGQLPSTPASTTTTPFTTTTKDFECNGSIVDTETQKCCDGNIINTTEHEICCGPITHDPRTTQCCRGSVLVDDVLGCCGGTPYNMNYQSCCAGKTYYRSQETCVNGKKESLY